MLEKSRGIERIIKAFRYSLQGLRSTFRHEAAFRQELFLAIVLIPVALVLDVAVVEQVIMITSVLLVLIVELLNSAIESVVDRIGEEHNELSERAKDMGSAAVFVALLLMGLTWVLLLA